MSYTTPPPPPGYPSMQPPIGQYPPKPSNHLVWSILVTLFCCLPFGIAAIVYSARVDSLWASGQYEASTAAADRAKMWIIWSVVAAFIGAVVYTLIFLGILSGGSN